MKDTERTDLLRLLADLEVDSCCVTSEESLVYWC